jgi:hypothetical protein
MISPRDDDAIMRRVGAMNERLQATRQAGLYYYNQPVS